MSTRPRLAAALCLVAALAISACGTNRYTHAAGQFGTLTNEITDDQSERLREVVAAEIEVYRAKLADDRARLAHIGCEREFRTAPGPDQCRLVLVEGNSFNELQPTPRLDNLLALNSALDGFAESLVTLAADSSADEEKFTNSLNGLATSLGGLDGAIRKATGKPEGDADQKFGAVASLIAAIGNFYFRSERAAALKRIILQSEPLVNEAVGILAATDDQLDQYQRAVLFDVLEAAQQRADQAQAEGDPEDIRAAQDALFTAVDSYNSPLISQDRFLAIGKAYGALVKAARANASITELKSAISQVLALAATVEATASAFDEAEDGGGTK